MSETITIKEFPAWKVDMARDMVARMTARFAKAAVKAGTVAPAAPEFTVTNVRELVVCSVKGCNARATMADLGKDCFECTAGYYVNKSVCDIVVTAESPTLGGWEFLAVIEPMSGGNMVRRVPGSDTAFDLTSYREGSALDCDHCNTPRHRKETFVVRADGSDPAVAKGTVKKVGRNCLSYFLGGKSPAAIVARLAWEKALREMGDEGGHGGGSTDESLPIEFFMTWVCATVRAKGWVSKGAATAYNEKVGEGGKTKEPTVGIVKFMLSKPPGERNLRAEWRALREECNPSDKDAEKAKAVIEWAAALTGSSDYEYNLSLVAKEPRVAWKNMGILGSAVGSYDRAMGAAERKKAEDALKVAAPLGKVEFEGEVIKTAAVTNDWGSTNKMTVKVTTEAGIWFAWMTLPDYLLSKTVTAMVDGKWTKVLDGYGSLDRDELVGRKLRIKATLEAGKEPHFVFGKRPSVEFADLYGPTPENPKVKKARKPKAPKTESVA